MRIIEEPIKERIRDGRVTDIFMPVFHRQLARHKGRARVVTILDEVQQIKSFELRQRFQPEVIEDQQVCFRQGGELLLEAAVATGDP